MLTATTKGPHYIVECAVSGYQVAHRFSRIDAAAQRTDPGTLVSSVQAEYTGVPSSGSATQPVCSSGTQPVVALSMARAAACTRRGAGMARCGA